MSRVRIVETAAGFPKKDPSGAREMLCPGHYYAKCAHDCMNVYTAHCTEELFSTV